MNSKSLIGHTLDSKYLIERELGQGGMGTVYLATHLGTERPVALKVIAPQFMQRTEFVERFKREARAAGRLRHPNVVDVTDFGFANTSQGQVAYLVMEYLDGCTLGEILEEEKQLPLGWTLDILEQVCSAVNEAHEQGIIHRDLKPDNIWLEPNLRGGYTVKVLDFGIAKLEEPMSDDREKSLLNPTTSLPTQALQSADPFSEQSNSKTMVENRNSTVIGDKGTLIQTDISEKGTAILPSAEIPSEKGTAIMSSSEIPLEDGTAILPRNKTQLVGKDEGTKLLSEVDETDKLAANVQTSDLTRVGAVLGTPLYMSPEQCRGEKLTPRSDIYSLGIIAYQMLSGKTPFTGSFTEVMDAHKELPPPPLEAKKVPKKVKKILSLALSKNVEDRPKTAEAFINKLNSNADGLGKLLQRAMIIYSEHLPKFLVLAVITMLPTLLIALVRVTINILNAAEVISSSGWTTLSFIFLSVLGFFVQIISSVLLVGTTTWIVAQTLAVPLREFSLKSALEEAKSRWKPLIKTVTVSTLLAMVGLALCFFPGVYLTARFMLITPTIMMEGLSGKAAFRRSHELVKRSFRTVFAVALLTYFVPAILSATIVFFIGSTIENFSPERNEKPPVLQTAEEKEKDGKGFNINYNGNGVEINTDDSAKNAKKQKEKPFTKTLVEGIFELLWTPLAMLIASFSSIVTGLIYLKTRQAGGESMEELLAKFEDAEHPRTNWQRRIRERLIQSGRVTTAERK